MQNRMNLTHEEKMIVNRFEGKTDRATAKNIMRMIPYLPISELEPAMSAVEKLQHEARANRTHKSFERALSAGNRHCTRNAGRK